MFFDGLTAVKIRMPLECKKLIFYDICYTYFLTFFSTVSKFKKLSKQYVKRNSIKANIFLFLLKWFFVWFLLRILRFITFYYSLLYLFMYFLNNF
jgi:hypothetical protein